MRILILLLFLQGAAVTQVKTTKNEAILELETQVRYNGIQLDWYSKSDTIISTFVVEKSMDGEVFMPIYELNASEEKSMSFLDNAPDYGTNHYRVIQQFNKERKIYSKIETEKYYLDSNSLNIYLDPVTTTLAVRIGHFNSMDGTVRIFRITGHQIFQQRIEKEHHLNIDFSSFSNGHYFLIIEDENRKFIECPFMIES